MMIPDEVGQDNIKRFKEIWNKVVIPQYKVDAKNLLKYIEQATDFFEAPSSTRYHNACKYGLVNHSLNVYDCLKKEIHDKYNDDLEQLEIDEAGIAIIALCHDLCKANFYELDYRNEKERDPNGKLSDDIGRFNWVSKPYYRVNDRLPLGHGEKSLILVQQFIRNLPITEMLCIRWHMGPMGHPGTNFAETNYAEVFNGCPLAMLTYFADTYAACVLELIDE